MAPVTYDFLRELARWTVGPVARDAVLAVLELHRPVETTEWAPPQYAFDRAGGAGLPLMIREAHHVTSVRCDHCVEWTNMGQRAAAWPCDTVAAVARALGVEATPDG